MDGEFARRATGLPAPAGSQPAPVVMVISVTAVTRSGRPDIVRPFFCGVAGVLLLTAPLPLPGMGAVLALPWLFSRMAAR
jgi:hypothetical protein